MNIPPFLNKSSVILSGGEVLRTSAIFSPKAVILSEGEPVNIRLTQDLPEPQSKDLACLICGYGKRHRTSLRRGNPSLVASKSTNSPRAKETLRVSNKRLLLETRSFDCGSGESFEETTLHLSPPLRMTNFFFAFIEKGAAQ